MISFLNLIHCVTPLIEVILDLSGSEDDDVLQDKPYNPVADPFFIDPELEVLNGIDEDTADNI